MANDQSHVEKLENMINELIEKRRASISGAKIAEIQLQLGALRQARDEEAEMVKGTFNWKAV